MAQTKHSVELHGYRTSLKIEDEFWDALRQIAVKQNVGLDAIVSRVADRNNNPNLSSAVRVFVLKHFQQQG